jgi:hypothetical protein
MEAIVEEITSLSQKFKVGVRIADFEMFEEDKYLFQFMQKISDACWTFFCIMLDAFFEYDPQRVIKKYLANPSTAYSCMNLNLSLIKTLSATCTVY